MEPLLSLNNVEVIYNDVILVLKGMSLKVEPGKIVLVKQVGVERKAEWLGK
jgi:branched-chain amino acid transport system ATP-binding protein